MDNDTTKGVNPPKTARDTPITNGIIINGVTHVLVNTQREYVCEGCSLLLFCADQIGLLCRLFTDETSVRFEEL